VTHGVITFTNNLLNVSVIVALVFMLVLWFLLVKIKSLLAETFFYFSSNSLTIKSSGLKFDGLLYLAEYIRSGIFIDIQLCYCHC